MDELAPSPPPAPPSAPRARATWALVAANIAIFGLQVLWGGSESSATLYRMGANIGREGLAREPWRLLASAFLHIGPVHLALNMWALFIFGSVLERFVGASRLIVLYGVSALGGGLLSALVHTRTLAAGASGAVWGLMTAELVLILRLRKIHGAEAVPGGWSVAQPLVVNLLFSLAPGIDLAAHLGGGITGALFLLGLTRRRWIEWNWKPAAVATVLFMGGSVGLALMDGRPWELDQVPAFEAVALEGTPVRLSLPRGLWPSIRETEARKIYGFGRFPRDPMVVICSVVALDAPVAPDERESYLAKHSLWPVSGATVKEGRPLLLSGRPALHYAWSDAGRPVQMWAVIDGPWLVRLEVWLDRDVPEAWRHQPQSVAETLAFGP